jgi:hypothetical protein
MFVFTRNQAEVINVIYKDIKKYFNLFYAYNIYIIKYIKILQVV